MNTLISSTGTPTDDPYAENTITKEIYLQKNKYYYYELKNMETTKQTKNSLKLGVEMPGSGFIPSNHAFEVSKIHIDYTPVMEAYNIDIWNVLDASSEFFIGMKSCSGGKWQFNKNAIPATKDACAAIVAAFGEWSVKASCETVEIDSRGKVMKSAPTTDDSDDWDWDFLDDQPQITPVGLNASSVPAATCTSAAQTPDAWVDPNFQAKGWRFTVTFESNRKCKSAPRFIPMHPYVPGTDGKPKKIYFGSKKVSIKERGSSALSGTFSIDMAYNSAFPDKGQKVEIKFDESAASLQTKIRADGWL
jgi:hypothetical protein